MCNDDVMDIMYHLFDKARRIHHEDVVNNGMSYARFVKNFYHGNRHIDCKNSTCRNIHAVILIIVHEVLLNHKEMADELLFGRDVQPSDCIKLKKAFDTTVPYPPKISPSQPPHIVAPPPTFECNMTEEQIMRITAFADTNYLFSFCSNPINELYELFTCKEGFRLTVTNIRNVAVLFDALYEFGYISRGWQTVIQKRKLLYSKNGIPITATTLSTALSEIKKSPTAISTATRALIKALHENR